MLSILQTPRLGGAIADLGYINRGEVRHEGKPKVIKDNLLEGSAH